VSVEFHTATCGFSIRPATLVDAKAVRMLLPDFRDTAVKFVAVDGQHGLVIGAAAAAGAFRRQPLAGPGIGLHVIEPCRRCGVGTALLQYVERAVLAAGATALYSAQRVALGSDEMQHWRRLGFVPCTSVEEHVLPLAQFEPQLGPLVERLRARGRIPADAQIIPLYKASHADVLQLHLDYMGGDRGDLNRKLRGTGSGAFHPRYSRVLVVGNKTRGCILAHRADKDTAIVDADIVDAGLRGGWANVWLKLEATRGALRLGIKQFRFTTFDHYTDTRSIAAKLGGVTTRTTVLMMRPINQP
jgi:GNAT superfamily N-acetyltransferase